jgi:4-hydroxythreonine-4-phosphate dehydrogenase
MDVLDVGVVDPNLPHVVVSASAGRVAFDCIVQAIDLANAGRVRAICSPDPQEEALAASGVGYPDHTEILAHQSGSANSAMMLVNPQLRAMLVTVYRALLQAVAQVSIQRELCIVCLAHRTLRNMGIARPRIRSRWAQPACRRR